MVPRCLIVLLSITSLCSAQRRLIGTLPTFQHRVSGTLYAEGDHTFIVENFNYDGTGPTVYIYVYEKGVTVSRLGGGIILIPQGAASNGRLTRRYTNEELVVRLADCTACRAGLTIRDLQSFTVWCQLFTVFFSRRDIPADLFDQGGEDVLTPPSTYNNCQPLDGNQLQVSWTVDQPQDSIFIRLCGCVDESDYMAFGISGSDSSVEMVGADAVVTWHDSEGTGAVDYYLSARAQCRPNIESGPKGACPDDVQGGTSNVTALRGSRESNGRCVDYVRPLSAVDAVLDRAITPSTAQYIVWATGPRGTVDGFAYFHTSWPSNLQTTLQFGRRATNNCGALSCSMPPTCPFTQETFCVTNMDATFVAKIGQSGGQRGYEGLTSHSGWGITWYLNSTLIPIIKVTRGNTYTFLIYGGDNSSNAGEYHPFYITDSVEGGRLANTPQEKQQETVFAGITAEGTAEAVGPLCIYEEGDKSASTHGNCSTTFIDYFRTLQQDCRAGQPGVLQWTPDMNTPDTVYYQCATHKNLGWKIEVSDGKPMPSPTSSMQLPSATTVQAPTPTELPTAVVNMTSTSAPCPEQCSRTFCKGKPNRICSLPPPVTVPGCTGRCPVTVCRACYYTNETETRSQPDECPYECGMNPKQGCMKKWGKCVRQSYLGSFGKPKRRLKKQKFFKCLEPTGCDLRG